MLGRDTDEGRNGGVHVDYAYGSSFVLSNDTDAIVLSDPFGQKVDEVRWAGTRRAAAERCIDRAGRRHLVCQRASVRTRGSRDTGSRQRLHSAPPPRCRDQRSAHRSEVRQRHGRRVDRAVQRRQRNGRPQRMGLARRRLRRIQDHVRSRAAAGARRHVRVGPRQRGAERWRTGRLCIRRPIPLGRELRRDQPLRRRAGARRPGCVDTRAPASVCRRRVGRAAVAHCRQHRFLELVHVGDLIRPAR